MVHLDDEPFFEKIKSEDYIGLNLYEIPIDFLTELTYQLRLLEYNFNMLYGNSKFSNKSYFIYNQNVNDGFTPKTQTVACVNNYISSLNSFNNFIKNITEDICESKRSLNKKHSDDSYPPKDIHKCAKFLVEVRHIKEHKRKRIFKINKDTNKVYVKIDIDKFKSLSDKPNVLDYLPKNSDIKIPKYISMFHNKTRFLIKQSSETFNNRRENYQLHL